MAGTQLMLLSQPGKRRQIAIWAHDGHLARSVASGILPLGSFLRRKLGDDYVALATLFHEGKFLASRGPDGGRHEYVAPPPPLHFVERDLAAASGGAGCFVDLREASQDPRAKEWMSRPRPLRQYGAFELSEYFLWPPVRLANLWSSVLFIRHSSPSRELPPPSPGSP
jgi:erythromycin esterase-like protein